MAPRSCASCFPKATGVCGSGARLLTLTTDYGRHLAKLLTNGGVDTTFTSPFPRLPSFPRPIQADASALYSLVEQSDGKLVAGGVLYIGTYEK